MASERVHRLRVEGYDDLFEEWPAVDEQLPPRECLGYEYHEVEFGVVIIALHEAG